MSLPVLWRRGGRRLAQHRVASAIRERYPSPTQAMPVFGFRKQVPADLPLALCQALSHLAPATAQAVLRHRLELPTSTSLPPTLVTMLRCRSVWAATA